MSTLAPQLPPRTNLALASHRSLLRLLFKCHPIMLALSAFYGTPYVAYPHEILLRPPKNLSEKHILFKLSQAKAGESPESKPYRTLVL